MYEVFSYDKIVTTINHLIPTLANGFNSWDINLINSNTLCENTNNIQTWPLLFRIRKQEFNMNLYGQNFRFYFIYKIKSLLFLGFYKNNKKAHKEPTKQQQQHEKNNIKLEKRKKYWHINILTLVYLNLHKVQVQNKILFGHQIQEKKRKHNLLDAGSTKKRKHAKTSPHITCNSRLHTYVCIYFIYVCTYICM